MGGLETFNNLEVQVCGLMGRLKWPVLIGAAGSVDVFIKCCGLTCTSQEREGDICRIPALHVCTAKVRTRR